MRQFLLSFAIMLCALFAGSQFVCAQTQYKVNENFESISSGIPTGWDNSEGTTETAGYRWSSYSDGYTGRGLRFNSYNNSTGKTNALKTPAMTGLNVGNWILKFKYKNPTGGDFKVFISIDGDTTSIFTNLTGQTDWTSLETDLTNYLTGATATSQVKIVFFATSNYGYGDAYVYLDDVVVMSRPTCQAPTGAYINTLTQTSATVNWSLDTRYGSAPDNIHITLKDVNGSIIATDTVNGLYNTYSITGLTGNTVYTVYLSSDCDIRSYSGFSDSAYVQFTTMASAQNVPFFDDFNSVTSLPTYYYLHNATLNTATSYSLENTGNSVKLTTTAADGAYIITPLLNIAADNAEVDFYIRRQSSSTANVNFQVGYLTDPSDIEGSFVPVLYDSLPKDAAWVNKRFNTADVGDQTSPVMFCINIGSGIAASFYVDNINIHTIPSCTRPENLRITNYGATDVTLDWNMANANNVRVYAMNQADSSVVTGLATQHPYTLTGLTPQANYKITVRGLCSANDSSELSTPVYVKTRCDVAASTTFFEGAEATTGTAIPDCWETGFLNSISSSTTNQFSTQTSTKVGTRGFQFNYSTSGSQSYLCSQAINFDQSGKYSFRYKMNRRSGSLYPGEGLKVYVTPTVGDTTNAVEVIPFINHYADNAPQGNSGWNELEGIINYQGTGYIMIVGTTKNGWQIYFDDLEVFLTPTCPKVSNISIGNTTQSTADLTWTAGYEETQWVVDYELKQGTASLIDTTVIVSGQPLIQFTGLNIATTYKVDATVRALCGVGDTAEAVTATNRTFTTQCGALTSLPYTMGFENAETYAVNSTNRHPICWTHYNSITDISSSYHYYPYTYSSYPRTGSLALYYYASKSSTSYGDTAMFALPQIQASAHAMNTLRIKFWTRMGTASYSMPLYVGVMTDPNDPATFVVVDSVTVTGSTYVENTVSFANYAGNGEYMAFAFYKNSMTSSYASLCIDDVTVDPIPSCADLVGGLTTTDVTSSSATFTMSDQTATNWQYAYGLAGTPLSLMTPTDHTGSTLTISGLDASTTYDIYVRRDCGAGNYGAWTEVAKFKTTTVPAQMPYVCDFEDDQENARWQFVDGAGSNVLVVGNAQAAVYDGLNAIYTTSSRTASPAPYSYNQNSASKSFAYRTMHFDAKGYQLELKFKSSGGEGGYDFGRIFLTSAAVNLPSGEAGVSHSSTQFPTIAVELDGEYRETETANPKLNVATVDTGWNTISYYLDMTNRPGNYNLVFMWNNDGSAGSGYPLAVDNINIYELTCLIPSSVMVTNISASTADINIQQATANEWEVVVADEAFTKEDIPDSVTYRAIVTNPLVSLTDLTANTTYYYAVRTICGANDTSDWTAVADFRTFCSMVEIPFTEEFDNANSTNCWSNIGTSGSITWNTSYKKSGNGSMKIAGTSAVSPELNVVTLAPDMINGWCYSTVDSATFAVGVMTDPNDVSTYIDLTTVMIPKKNTWTEFTSYFTLLNDPEYAEWAEARYIVLAVGSDATVYFDKFIIDETPTCPKPTEVSITNITATSFDIAFTDNAGASEWVVYVNGNPNVINDNPATITGLTAHTPYTIGIAAVCSAADTSYVTDCASIMTECDVLPTPYTCGFETTDGFNATSTVVLGVLEENCWSTLGMSSSMPYYKITNSTYLHSGSQGLQGFSGANKYGYFILPAFADPTNTLFMDFWYRNEGVYDSSPFVEIGYMTDATNDSTFVMLQQLNKTVTMTKAEQSFVNPAIPANARIAIRFGGTTSSYYYCGIDDINVRVIRSCSDPDAPVASNITASSAKVTINDTCAAHTAWEYVYGVSGFNPNTATPVSVDTTVFTINGLNDQTVYDVYVRAVCGVGDESNFVKGSFKTLCSPYHVTATNMFSETFSDYDFNSYLRTGTCYNIYGEPSNSYYWATVYPTYDPATSTSSWRYCYGHSTDPSDKCLYWQMYSSQMTAGSILRQFHLDGGQNYEISAYVRSGDYSGYTTKAYALVGQAANALDTLASRVLVSTDVDYVYAGGIYWYYYGQNYEQIKAFFTPDSTGDYLIGFQGGFNNTSDYSTYLYLDDWTVKAYAGCSPKSAAISNVTATSAHVTMAGAAYQFEYVLNDTTLAATIADSVEFDLSGLSAASSYVLYVRTYCDATTYSEWMPVQFATACGTITAFPYSQDFEGYATGTTPTCWSTDQSTTPTVSTANVWGVYAYGGNQMLRMNEYSVQSGDVVIETPPFVLPTQPMELSFDYTNTASEAFLVKISTNGGSSYSTLATYQTTGTGSSAYIDPGTFTHAVIDLTAYAGQTVKFELYNYSQYGYGAVFFDNMMISAIPACREPQVAPTVSATTMTTLTAHAGMAMKDTIEFGVAPYVSGVTSAAITATALSTDGNCTLTGLNGNTQYAVWYRYHCGEDGISGWSKSYARATTMATDCFNPQNLRTVGVVNDHHAAFTWGIAPSVTRYDYELYFGTSTSGILVDSGSTTVLDTVVFDSLTAQSPYYFRVVGYCSDDTTAWVGLGITTTKVAMQLPFICNFEDATVNNAWEYSNNTGVNMFVIGNDGGAQNGGSQSLYVSDDNSTYQYSNSTTSVSGAEVLLEIPAGNYLVQYDWLGYGESSYDYGRMFLAPSNHVLTGTSYDAYKTLPSGAIALDNNSLLNKKNVWQSYNKIVNVPTDGVYKLMVTWCNDYSSGSNPPIAIDNLSIEEILCMPLTSVEELSLTSNTAKYVATRYQAGLDIQYGCSTVDSQDSITWTTIQGAGMSDTIVLNGLAPLTNYYLFVRELCDSTTASPVTRVAFKTPGMANALPFICGFEAGETTAAAWQLVGADNQFVIGGGASSQGSAAMYISNDGSTLSYSTTTTSNSYAYVPLAFGPGTYDIEYDWQNAGESGYDYARVYLAPASFVPVAGTQATCLSTSSTPQGWIALDGGSQLQGATTWRTRSIEQTFADSTTMNLFVCWHNDASGGTQPPFAIDNISITKQLCTSLPSDSLAVDTIGLDLISIKFYNPTVGASTEWIVSSDSQYGDTIASGLCPDSVRVFTATGLNPSTMYYVALRSVCGVDTLSKALKFNVRTNCASLTVFPYDEGFETMSPVNTWYSGTSNQFTNACWTTTAMNSTAGYACPVNASGSSSAVHSGDQGMLIFNTYNEQSVQTFALPEMDNLNGKTVSFWHYGSNTTYYTCITLEFGYISTTGSFTTLATVPNPGAWTEYTTTINNLPAGVTRLAFRLPGALYYYLDDIHINDIVQGSAYYDTICNGAAYNAHGFSYPAGTLVPGDTTLTAVMKATTPGAADSITTAHVFVRPAVSTEYYDTICAGQPYQRGMFNIPSPTTRTYFRTFQSTVTGCDSTVNLHLYVYAANEVLYDTICQGDSYQFGTQTLTQTGVYSDSLVNPFGCMVYTTLHLLAVDSAQVTNATICQGQSYQFEGQTYTQSGTYKVQTTGARGCPVNKTLNLTVTQTDSTCNVSFCKGGSVMVADTTIKTAGSYTLVRVNLAGCDVTYHITATQTDPTPSQNYDYACEGHLYYGYGISGITVTKDTVITVNTRTLDAKCDSVSIVHLTYVATKRTYETAQIVQGDVYHWNGRDLTEEGNYQADLQSVEGCDSIVYLTLSYKGVGVENVADIQMSVVPNPVTAGQTSFVYGNFTDVKNVEVLNSFGQVIDAFVPESYPIEVQGINAAGIYFVRITTTDDKVAIQKLIVK